MNEKSAQFTGSIPANYDEGLGPHIFEGYASDLAARVAALDPRAVLELAAGTGIVTRKLRDALGTDTTLVASDLNAPMLDVAKAKFRPDEAVTFELVDATDIAFGDGSFDAVACQFGVMFFPDKARSYAEVHRVLAPGGSYVFNVWGTLAENPFARLAHEVLVGFFPEDPPGFYQVPFGYNDPAEIRGALMASGFGDVRIEDVRLTSTVISADKLATGLVFGNPSHEEIVSRGGDADAVRSAIAAAIEKELDADMPLVAKVIQARKA